MGTAKTRTSRGLTAVEAHDDGPEKLTRGAILGNYRLLAILGEGGMGEVWAASDIRAPSPRIVAIKVAKTISAEAAAYLFDEARIAQAIHSPSVCRVIEFGESKGFHFLVLDWCDGANLQELLEASPERRISELEAARIVAEVAAGLHAAHSLRDEKGKPLNVVHRDVSPQNILLARDGRVLVTDFGIAKASDQQREATETGQVKGKTSYLAPEQIRSKLFDHRVDVFALGAVLYTSVVGKKPFAGEDALATIYQILEGQFPKPRAIRADVSEELEGIILKALSISPEQRFQTMLEFRTALESFLRTRGTRVVASDLRKLLEERLGERMQSRNDRIIGILVEEVTPTAESSRTIAIRQLEVEVPRPRSLRSLSVLVGGITIAGAVYWGTSRSTQPTKIDTSSALTTPTATKTPSAESTSSPSPTPTSSAEVVPSTSSEAPLVPETKPPAPSAKRSRTAAPRSGAAVQPNTTQPAAPTSGSARKPSRSLDTENPFTKRTSP